MTGHELKNILKNMSKKQLDCIVSTIMIDSEESVSFQYIEHWFFGKDDDVKEKYICFSNTEVQKLHDSNYIKTSK